MTNEYVTLGKIGAPHGVRGWVRIISYTDAPTDIFDFAPWQVGKDKTCITIAEYREQNNKLIARFEGCDDRNHASRLTNQEIVVTRDRLPELSSEQYYWEDLTGLKVNNLEGDMLGEVTEVFSTGANDVLAVEGDRRRLIPFLKEQVIHQVDIPNKTIIVDWDKEF